jgi:hypothetical protein
MEKGDSATCLSVDSMKLTVHSLNTTYLSIYDPTGLLLDLGHFFSFFTSTQKVVLLG